MTTEEPVTSVWLVPAEPDRAELRLHLDQLAVEHSTPSFEPHITLVSAVVGHDEVLAAIERVAASTAPLEMVAGPTAHGPDRFKAVFVEIGDIRVHALALAFEKALGLPPGADSFRPHLSLLYAADLAPATRDSIAAAHSWQGRVLRFDTLVASAPGAGIDDIARWQTTIARRLAGHA